jgi:hypothetical protein
MVETNHHQKDGSNMFKPYKSWDIWDKQSFSTGGLRNHLQFACMNLLRSCCGYMLVKFP